MVRNASTRAAGRKAPFKAQPYQRMSRATSRTMATPAFVRQHRASHIAELSEFEAEEELRLPCQVERRIIVPIVKTAHILGK
ncbi:hypothetical protein C5748_12780 [Phyllobacterium phragmitis]|uniref:Uncharacterized protein n=1 Tax=Phyllobacterium phragmitis TaxID=2670329 RepID=A0A2S9IRD0_9HYPH|nr:hypothetical protein C5748_12780 [Phyllobacterium phragmitis]